MKVAGLSIEGGLARATVVERRLGGSAATKADDIRLPDDEGERYEALKGALGALKEAHRIKGVVAGLDLRHFSHHYIDLPVTSRKDIRHALSFELEKHLPLPPEEYVFDFVTVEAVASGSRNLVLAVRRDKLGWIASCVTDAGLKLLGIRCSTVEALNGLLQNESAADSLFVSSGERCVHVIGIKGAAPAEIKSARDGIEAAAHIEGLSEAYRQGAFSMGLKDAAGLESMVTKSVSYDVSELLALSALRKTPVRLDFTPEELRGRKTDIYPYAIGAMCAVSVVLFFSTTWLSYYKDVSALKEVEARIEDIKRTSSGLMETQRELEAIDEKRQFLFKFEQRRNRHINILRHLSEILPRDAWLTSFYSDDKGKIEIQGYAKRAASLIGPLEGSDLFKNVEFSSPVTVRDNRERFSIRMGLEK